MKQALPAIAAQLDQAAFSATATQQISLSQKINLAEAYHIQKLSIERRYERGEKLTGYKLGFTSKAKMEQMGIHDLIWGSLTDEMHIKNGGMLEREKYIHPRVEPEIAFLIGKRIDHAITLEATTDYLEGVAGALEIIDSRYENFKFSLEDVVADNCSSAAYVIGDWLSPNITTSDLTINLNINGNESQSGNSNAILGNPLETLVEISRILSQQGMAIKSGTIILAGAATSAVYINAGDEIEGQFENLGTIKLSVK